MQSRIGPVPFGRGMSWSPNLSAQASGQASGDSHCSGDAQRSAVLERCEPQQTVSIATSSKIFNLGAPKTGAGAAGAAATHLLRAALDYVRPGAGVRN